MSRNFPPLEVLSAEILAELPRARRDRLRVEFVRALCRSERDPIAFVSLRIWFESKAGEMCPSRTGITVREDELDTVIEALQRAHEMRAAPPDECDP